MKERTKRIDEEGKQMGERIKESEDNRKEKEKVEEKFKEEII